MNPDVSPVPRVSLVLPVHNGAAYLGDALASIAAQSLADYELICVDDASSDASPALLAAAAAGDARVRIIRLDTNVGLPAALNTGFAHARGSYFSWTSDDNILRPQQLERLVAALDAHPDCAVAHSDYTVIDPAGDAIERITTGPATDLLLGNNVGASFLYRREVEFALGGYDPELFGAEDYDFWLRAAAHYRFCHVAEDLYLYRKHPRSLTNQRAAAIQAMTTDVVLEGLTGHVPPAKRGAALLGLFRRNHFRLRTDLLFRALRLAPLTALRQLPSLAWHMMRVLRHQTFM
ncbi:MAG: glycosyltransferase family 2 protein [Sphingopyxis sp.]|nr:glycosyltransferase family 2 protein [Sphingopyxis sp.]